MKTNEYLRSDETSIERQVELWNAKILTQSQEYKPQKRKSSYTFGLILICCSILYLVASGNRISQKELEEQRLVSLENKIDEGYKLSSQEGVEYCKLLNSVRNIYFDHCEKLAMFGGRVIDENEQKVGCFKRDFLFPDKSSAMNFGRLLVGHKTRSKYNPDNGQIQGWVNDKGDSIYWNHFDWYVGLGKSKFPHINFDVDGCKGHLFLKDKIQNSGLWNDFKEYFKL